MLGTIFSFFASNLGTILSGSNSLVQTIFGSKTQIEANEALEQQSVQQSYAAEFNAPEKQFAFDRFVDGVNRLVRPIFTYSTIALFVWAAVDPASFAISMQAMAIVPEFLWYILLTIVGFWFGTRMLQTAGPAILSGIKPPDLSQVRDVLDMQKELKGHIENQSTQIQNIQQSLNPPPVPVKTISRGYTDDKYAADMANLNQPLPNDAIAEWNKKNNPDARIQ